MQLPHISTTLFTIVILLCCFQANIISASIITPPTSLNTTLDAQAVFTCTVDNALTVYWLVNNNSSGLFSDIDSDLQMLQGGNTLLATLLVPAVSMYNQSIIVCGAVLMGSNGVVESDPVLLLIQGKLDSVGNLTITSIMDDHSSISVRWTPPHSLANIPINYTLTVTGQLYGYSSSQVTTDVSYIIDLPDLCDNYWLIVMATNTAGHGNNNTLIIYQMEATRIVSDTVEVFLAIPSPGSKPEATINFNVTHNCSIPLNHTIAVSLDGTDGDTLSLYGPYYTNSTNEMITLVIDELMEDTLYQMTVWDQTTAGTISDPVTVELSSYDVQNVSIAVDDGGVMCTTCYFIPGTEAGGCIIELKAEGDNNNYLSVHLSRRSEEGVASGCIQSLVSGVYLVKVYDAEQGGYKLQGAAPALIREGVSVMPHPSIMSTPVVTEVRSTEITSSSTSSIRTLSISISPTSGTDRSASLQPVDITYRNAAIGVGVVIIVVIIVLIALIIIQVNKLKQKRKQLNRGIIAESADTTVQFQAQVSSETTTTGVSSSTPSPPIETMSRDEEAPPPPPPPSSSAQPRQQQPRVTVPRLSVTSTSSSGSHGNDDRRHSDVPSSPGAESTTSFTNLLRPDPLRTRSDSSTSRPSSYHEPSMNLPPPGTTDYRRHIRGASNRTRTSSTLRSNTVMTAWAAVNPLTLPVLPEAPPPYDEIERDSTSYQRPQSALLMSSRTGDDFNSSSVYNHHEGASSPPTITDPPPPPDGGTVPVEYISLQFSPSSDSILSSSARPRDRSSNSSLTSGNVQYAIISNSNTYVSSHDRLGSFNITNSLV